MIARDDQRNMPVFDRSLARNPLNGGVYSMNAPSDTLNHSPYAHIDWSKTADLPATLPALLSWGVDHAPERDLILDDLGRITYAQAEAQSAVLARQLLAHGVGKETRI